MKVVLNKDLYIEWVKISNRCNKMREIVCNNDNLSVEKLIEWKQECSGIVGTIEKVRYNTLMHITKCNEESNAQP